MYFLVRFLKLVQSRFLNMYCRMVDFDVSRSIKHAPIVIVHHFPANNLAVFIIPNDIKVFFLEVR